MKISRLFCTLSLAALFAAGCSNEKSATPSPVTTTTAAVSNAAPDATAAATAATATTTAAPASTDTKEVGVITTSEGVMVVEFYPDVAPNHVANFEKLARAGFYDGTAFHRVIPGFMIQGGDPNTKDDNAKNTWGLGGPGYTVKAEFNSKHHARGILSMARSQDPDSAGSQFFICHADAGNLDGQYTVFGNLVKGFDVLDKIAATPTEAPDRPINRVNVISIKIVPASSVNLQ
jgi:peptidyl-prolyl cis-trans isomerase B (cyclophilin B)